MYSKQKGYNQKTGQNNTHFGRGNIVKGPLPVGKELLKILNLGCYSWHDKSQE